MKKKSQLSTAIAALIALVSMSFTTHAVVHPVLVPEIGSAWWTIATNPDLGAITNSAQQPVDFGIWQAADSTWQLWSCIRGTNAGRLFHGWEANSLTDSIWTPKGIVWQAVTSLGETDGAIQAPYVLRVGSVYNLFYGDWNRICLATSTDGKNFTRWQNAQGQPALFSGPDGNTRDPMVIKIANEYYCYYTSFTNTTGTDYVRTSTDLHTWSAYTAVSEGGRSGSTQFSAECPHVVYKSEVDRYYLFRTQQYGGNNISHVYSSPNPKDFGMNDDRNWIESLQIAAPEIVSHAGIDYIASCTQSLTGLRLARLDWNSKPLPPAPQNFRAVAGTGLAVDLAWTRLSAGVRRYVVYRNDSLIGETTDTTFTDQSVVAEQAYRYAVAAIDTFTQEGPNSAEALVTTAADLTAPSIVSVSAFMNNSAVTIVFSESVDAADAQSAANYAVDGSIRVLGATLQANGRTVVLATDVLTAGIDYQLTVNNIRDRSVAGNRCGVLQRTFRFQAAGQGLRATYYNTLALTDSAAGRVDTTINFNWGTGAPAAGVHTDSFSVRWTGTILAPVSGSYTFYANTNDGARLWINGVSVIDHWVSQPLAESNGTIALQAGEFYSIVFEFYENINSAQVELRWSYPGTAKTIIPRSALFLPTGSTNAGSGRGLAAVEGAGPLSLRTSVMSGGMRSVEAIVRLQAPAAISMSVFSVDGKLVTTLAKGVWAAGEHRVAWNVGNVPAGVYFVNLSVAGRRVSTERLMLRP